MVLPSDLHYSGLKSKLEGLHEGGRVLFIISYMKRLNDTSMKFSVAVALISLYS